MKKLIVVLLATAASFGTFAQTSKPSTKKETTQVKYTCPMHPDYVSNKPGKCPKCGMTLVKQTGKMKADTTKSKMKM